MGRISVPAKCVNILTGVFSLCAELSAMLIFLLVILISADVFGRYVLSSPIPGTFEVTEALMVFIVFLAYAHTEATGHNIRIQLIEKRITERQKTILDLPANILGMFIFGLICWQSWGQAWLSVESNLRMSGLLRLPLWPAKFVLVLGSSFLVLQFMIGFVSSMHKVLQRRRE